MARRRCGGFSKGSEGMTLKPLTRRTFLKTGAAVGGAAMIGSRMPAAAEGSPPINRDYVDLVDPWIASDVGRWYFFQSASNPFGLVKLRPDTSNDAEWGSGYYPSEADVKGFSHVHDWQIAGVQVMPTSGASVTKTAGEAGWQSPRVHDAGEIAEPGYHRLHLDRYGITAELTCTDRVGFHRYAYDTAGPSEIIINLGGLMGEALMMNAKVSKLSSDEIEGYVVQRGAHSGFPPYPNTLYFNIRFDKPFDSLHGWADGSLANNGDAISELAGEDMGVYARYEHLAAGAVVQMKVGLSFTGTEGARNNLEAELPGWDFNTVRTASQGHWNEMLSRIDVRGGTPQQRTKFYTDLFHVLCGRSMVSDADGKYLDGTWAIDRVLQIPLDQSGKPKFAMYNHDALWLTQWNLNSILGLAYPEIYSSFVQCHLQMYENGGLLPRGPVAGNYSMIMTSSPVTSFICGAWNKGIRDFDANLAFDAMLDAQSIGGLFDKENSEYTTWSNTGMRQYLDLGYIPADVAAGSAGRTMEYAYQDWTLAHFARQLNKKGINASEYATVTVSSQANNSNYAGVRAVDGRPIRSSISPAQNVEWASAGEQSPWIKLTWSAPRTIHRVVLSDRADPDSNANSGILTFSDGSSINVSDIPTDGGNKLIDFGAKSVTWVRFDATGGSGTNVGLNEIEVWDDTDVYAYLLERSSNWRNLFDTSTGFIRLRNSDGTWRTPFDPLSRTAFIESNSWQDGFFTVHDVMGLANLLGDRSTYAHKLNYAFVNSAPDNFSDRDGFINYGNQQSLEEAHLFNYVGYPWMTQYWVRQVQEKAYGSTSTTGGYAGDEDQGQMGSMSALMAIGLFEVTGGGLSRPVYDITSPIFDEVTITLNRNYYRGDTFRIITHNPSAENTYIQQAKLNGAWLDNAWFYHDQLAAGGTLELWLGQKPNKQWGTTVLPPSESKSNGQQPVVASAISIAGADTVTEPSANYSAQLTPDNTSLKLVFWSVTEPDGSPTNKATIDPNGTLTAKPPAAGNILITATAADEGGVTGHKTVSVNVPTVAMAIAPDRLTLLQATPASFRLSLTNNDSTQDHNTTFQAAAIPNGWTVTPNSGTITVPAGQVVNTALTVTPPADAIGASTLTLTAQGDWGKTQLQIPATVRPTVELVGNIDLSTAEFALSPDQYRSYSTTFPNAVDFTISQSDPGTAWSYIHPGPADTWAGSKPHTFTLHFDLPQTPDNDLVFTAWLVDTQSPNSPALSLTLNGVNTTTMQLPPGGGAGYFWGSDKASPLTIVPTSFDYTLPRSQLRTGTNDITITTTNGSWLVYDAFGIAKSS